MEYEQEALYKARESLIRSAYERHRRDIIGATRLRDRRLNDRMVSNAV